MRAAVGSVPSSCGLDEPAGRRLGAAGRDHRHLRLWGREDPDSILVLDVKGCWRWCYKDYMSRDDWSLDEAIATLRADLQAAINEGNSKDVQFGVGDIELTLQLVAKKQGGGNFGWSVLGINAGGSSERTHVVKLVLKPRYRTADGTYSEDFAIASRVAEEPQFGDRGN